MEPLTLLGSVGLALAKSAAAKAGAQLFSVNDVSDRLAIIESRLAGLAQEAHSESLHRGMALLQHASASPQGPARSRRMQNAEDHLIAAAEDTMLSSDGRAVAAWLMSTTAGERGERSEGVTWLWRANGFIAKFVNDNLYYSKSILSEDAPAFVREDLRKQAQSSKLARSLGLGKTRVSHLRSAP